MLIERKQKTSGKGNIANAMTGENLQQVTVEETSTVAACDSCGADLSGVDPSAQEERVQKDIIFKVVTKKVVADIKQCPECGSQTKGRFPDDMPGPLQYGMGFQSFVVNLVVAQMVSLRRSVELVQAISDVKLSESPTEKFYAGLQCLASLRTTRRMLTM